MFTIEESWDMTESERILAIVREVGCWRLGDWDGCCCSIFNLRGVEVQISCGKGSPQAVRISGTSDCHGEAALTPIMDEVIRQLIDMAGRGGDFARQFVPLT